MKKSQVVDFMEFKCKLATRCPHSPCEVLWYRGTPIHGKTRKKGDTVIICTNCHQSIQRQGERKA